MLTRQPRVGDKIRDARFRSRVGAIEARVGREPHVHYYVAFNDGRNALVPACDVHDERLSIYGYILIPCALLAPR